MNGKISYAKYHQIKFIKISRQATQSIRVRPSGTKTWSQKYRFSDKEQLITHGSYPMVSLRQST